MHLVIGGAYNGKRNYVTTKLTKEGQTWTYIDASEYKSLREAVTDIKGLLVVDNIHQWLANTTLSELEAIETIITTFLEKQVIFILTEMGRGIVPIEASQRQLRDTIGRLYQQLFQQADEITRIWYGLSQTLKQRGEA